VKAAPSGVVAYGPASLPWLDLRLSEREDRGMSEDFCRPGAVPWATCRKPPNPFAVHLTCGILGLSASLKMYSFPIFFFQAKYGVVLSSWSTLLS
jgi:hypothetical protein